MRPRLWPMGVLLTLAPAMAADDPSVFWRVRSLETNVIASMQSGGALSWTNTAPGRTDQVERTSSLLPGTWRDYVLFPSTGATSSLKVLDETLPPDMALIPAGVFAMGDRQNEGSADETPLHWVYTSAFRIDRHPVTKALWDAVVDWGADNGYGFDLAGAGKASNHPVQTVSWFDCVKWCNVRSQLEGRTPMYYADAGFSEVYKTGQIPPCVNWSANGYRLPTEAEWEKAARGGAPTNRLSWWDSQTIDHTRANYRGYPAGYAFDLGYFGYDTNYLSGGMPYTSPVGIFESGKSGYNVSDMAGNVWEWCWDWYDGTWYAREDASAPDTRGPSNGAYRVVRGGAWSYYAWGCRASYRFCHVPAFAWNTLGFRTVLNVDP